MGSPLIPEVAFAGPRRALARTLVHLCDYTPITSTTVDGDEVAVPGTTSRDVRGQVTISVPTLTVAHDVVLAEGGVITNIRNSKGESLLAGPLTVDRRTDDDPLGLPLLRTYALHGADPGRA
jgi:hypothetical protein